jgi:FkbM family methyltransferase
MSRVFFQIGTNNGNDLFRQRVIQNKPDIVILVEPNQGLIDQIKFNYRDIDNVFIYNNAIFYNDDETVELYIPAKNGIMGTTADNGITYLDVHFSLLPMNDWGSKDDMVKISSKTITFDKICSIHNITTIDYLQIDTEGFDTEIIKMIDFSKFKINTIRFESWTFSTDCFTKFHNDKSNELGVNGFNNAIDILKKNNYTISKVNDMDGDDILATLQQNNNVSTPQRMNMSFTM